MSADSVVGIGWDVLKRYVVVPIERGFGYVISSKRFANRLQREVQYLENEVLRVEVLAEQARNNVRKFHVVFTTWKESADKALEEAQELLDDFKKAPKTCCYGTLPDPKSRYRFSRKAEGKIEDIKQVTQKCSRFNGLNDISFIEPPFTSSASTLTKLGDDGVFASRALMIQNIMGALANNSNSVVGVYGMGGVGKSTLLADAEKRIRVEKSFDLVAQADVSEHQDIKRIQEEIACALGLSDLKNEEYVSVRAKHLHRRLQDEERNKKKVLIILDNLWKGLDLKSVGIPCGSDNKVMGCKLLLTSRDRDILRRDMGCDKDFPLGELEEEEARSLFERLVGDKVYDGEFKPLADEALDKCAGVPFLIVAMAKRFKYADLSEWKDTLKKIEKSKDKKINDLINQMLQWNYDKLEEEVKSLLRLCVVYGISKPSLENLVRYGIGLGLLQDVSSMEEARNRLISHIHALQASSFLLDSEDVDGFKIHDLVREFVTSVASREHPLLVLQDKDKSIIESSKDKLNSYRAICFPYVDMKELPQELDCSELQIFLLFTNNESLMVPDSLFHSMRKLMVLNLTGIHLTCTPLSPFQFLENLHTLCLDSCSLDNIVILGELKGLQILSFVNSTIHRLPKEIGQLVKLRLLDLNHCELEIIEPGVLRNLIKLEELYMKNSFDQWNTMDQIPPTNASLIELNHMKNLHTLHVSIPNSSVLPEDLNVEKLTKYKIQIGNVWRRWSKFKGSRTLDLELDPLGNVLWKKCIQSILGKIDDLFLDKLDRNERSVCTLSQKGFPELKHLQVKNSSSIHYILQLPSHTHFTMLESLLLKNLINLEMICNSHISSKSFNTLKVVRIESCDKMEVLFPLLVVRGLPQLEEIEVVDCKLMHAIVEAKGCGKFELRNLHVLKLCNLPRIKSFFNTKVAPLSSTSGDQVSTQIAFFNGQQVSIPSLESLTMEGVPNLKEIWNDESPLELSNLHSLKVVRCKSLLKVISSQSLLKLPKLHTLTIKDCISVQEIFDLDGPSGSGNVETLSQLTILELNEMRSLRCIWNKNPCGIVSYHNLRKLEVDDCDNLRFMFFPCMVKSLTQVRDLRVHNCKKMETIIMEEEWFEMETSETLELPMLTNLNLECLESLKCFFQRKCSLEAQSQDRIKSHSTALFSQEVAFPSLETLNIKDMDNIEKIWDNQVAENSFHNLKSLCVDGCTKLVNLVPSCILRRLLSLESLKANNCGSVEVVFKFQPLNPLDGHHIALLLKELTVSILPKLKCVWDKEIHHQVKFQCLHSINISSCRSLTSLFPASLAIDLMQLEKLNIDECGIMELIEKKEGQVPKFVFPMLTSLQLKYLRELKCLYTGTHTFHWPALKTLEVWGCDKVEIFASHPENEMPLDKQPLFLIEKIAFPSLEALHIVDLNNIEMIWDNQVAADSFPKLKSLCVDRCNKLVKVVRSFILTRLSSLERLDARRCRSLEVVFELQPLNHADGYPITLPLKELRVLELPKLKNVFDKELHHQVEFQCLRSISISRCESLTSLFPASIAKDLKQLEELKIDECGMAEIIEKEEGLGLRFVFPMLTSLKLKYLRELKCLYTGTHISHWPTLKTLKVLRCDRVEILASCLGNEMPLDKPPLFLVEKGAFPNLQELKLILSERMEIWHGHFHDEEFFSKLRVLELRHLSKEYIVSTCHFVESLTNLEELVVCESYLEESTSNVEAIEGPCQEIKVILPFSRYIQHLKTLNVSCCSGLSSIFTSTIAENLVSLTKLRISNCRILTEVISDEGSKEDDVVAFKHLKFMELDGLIKLRCFSSGRYTLIFPLLEDVIVTRCPNMKFFSKGSIEASKLERVKVSRGALFWKENLNNTIQNLFKEMGMFVGAKFIQLSMFPELIGKWHSRLNPIKSSWQLRSLVVDKCPSFVNAIPSKLMLLLKNLNTLQVCDCESLEEIFDLEGLEVVESTQVLSSFMTLNLVNLPKLRRLWNKDLQGSLPYNFLIYITLYKCNNLKHAFVPTMARCLAILETMEIKECGQMERVIAGEEGQGSAVENITFPKLYLVKLECLLNLTSFLLGNNYTLECPILNELTIIHCPKIRSLTGQSLMEIDHSAPSLFTIQVQFPKLRSMDLSHMDNLSKLWIDTPQETLTFDCLWKVEVRNCKGLENLFPYWVATSLIHLEKLQVESCEIEEIVANGGDTPSSNTTQDLFPQLTSLVLRDMPRLKSFFPNLPTLHWPLLKELRVTHCDKLNMLSFTASMNSWVQRDDQKDLSNQEAHSSFERDFPNFERLLLVNNNIQMIQDGNFPEDIFGKPKALTLACFHDEKAAFPLKFLRERFQNLQSLEIFCSSFEDIFPEEGLVDNGKHPMLESLRDLKLNKLQNLKSVWREDSLVSKILQSIETFKVWDCPCLMTIFPTVTSFQKLTSLEVKNCSRLVYLITASAVTNLVHLTWMTIIGCEKMKEVVANEGNGEGQVISFGNLQYLTLQHLPSLECFFSSPSSTLRFPSLCSMKVEECPKMKTFSKGTLNTPWLHGATLFRYKWNWGEDDDLNTAIQKLAA